MMIGTKDNRFFLFLEWGFAGVRLFGRGFKIKHTGLHFKLFSERHSPAAASIGRWELRWYKPIKANP